MKSRDFVYWLQGFFEVSEAKALTDAQVTTIKSHLNLVFKHEIDPEMGDLKHQNDLNKTHSPGKHPSEIMFRC